MLEIKSTQFSFSHLLVRSIHNMLLIDCSPHKRDMLFWHDAEKELQQKHLTQHINNKVKLKIHCSWGMAAQLPVKYYIIR